MDPKRQKVIESITTAFKGVVLGNGIGLREGNGLDDYADEETCKVLREQDEKNDWEAIPAKSLNDYHASLSYFDAEGMRFHIPAFMVADLKGELGWDPIFHLTQLTDYSLSKFTLFSPLQRKAIRSYLLFVKNEPNYQFDRPHIERSLEDYWRD